MLLVSAASFGFTMRCSVALPALSEFGFLTALDDGLRLVWAGGETEMKRGESFFLPKASPALAVCGSGRAALSMPKVPSGLA